MAASPTVTREFLKNTIDPDYLGTNLADRHCAVSKRAVVRAVIHGLQPMCGLARTNILEAMLSLNIHRNQ